MHVGLYFGSFNPVHIGHLAIANYMVEFTDLDRLWFVVSPHNPFKKKKSLLEGYHRYEMLHRSLEGEERMEVSDVEFRLPQPSYTATTLAHLTEKFPSYKFSLIMGSDGLSTFHKWRNANILENNYHRYVYPRPGFNAEELYNHKNISLVEAPMMEISSSFIRESIKKGKDVKHFLPLKAYLYINEMNFYRK